MPNAPSLVAACISSNLHLNFGSPAKLTWKIRNNRHSWTEVSCSPLASLMLCPRWISGDLLFHAVQSPPLVSVSYIMLQSYSHPAGEPCHDLQGHPVAVSPVSPSLPVPAANKLVAPAPRKRASLQRPPPRVEFAVSVKQHGNEFQKGTTRSFG